MKRLWISNKTRSPSKINFISRNSKSRVLNSRTSWKKRVLWLLRMNSSKSNESFSLIIYRSTLWSSSRDQKLIAWLSRNLKSSGILFKSYRHKLQISILSMTIISNSSLSKIKRSTRWGYLSKKFKRRTICSPKIQRNSRYKQLK